jgi:flagellar hook-associated protein 2
MAGISDVGLGSGINITKTVEAMVRAEQAPKQSQLNKQKDSNTVRITALGALRSAITDFQKALSGLNKPESFQGRTAKSSSDDLLGISANTTAGAGSYKVEVKQLAASSKVALAAIKAPGDAPLTFGTGTLNLKVGNGEVTAIKVDESNNTLEGLRDSINKVSVGSGISATIVSDSNGPRLVLSSAKTGEGKDISVEGIGGAEADSVSLSRLSFNPGLPVDTASGAAKQITQAMNAKLTVDGLDIESTSNTVDQAIEGVTLTLKGLTPDKAPLTIGVELDTAGVKKNVQSFVDSYNKLMDAITAQTRVTQVGEDKKPLAGALVGDATARTLVNSIRGELASVQGSGALRGLMDIGVTTQKDGKLLVDGPKLDKAIAANFSEVANIFTGEKGLATRLDEKLKPYSETGGILSQRDKAIQESDSKIKKQQEALNVRMASLEERLYKQWYSMDAMVSKLSSTSNSLAAMLTNLPGVINTNRR